MESEHGTTTPAGLSIHPDSSVNSVDLSTAARKLISSSSISSSSSPDSPLDEPFKDDDYETCKSAAKIHEDTLLDSKNGEKNISGSPIPRDDQSNHELPVSTLPPMGPGDTHQLNLNNTSTTDSPPIQAMERSGDSTYRIPSYVFARTKSTAPEWSLASNESLFSIHMGNMSFSNDPIFWRSGELGLPGEPTTAPQIFNYAPPNQPPVNKTSDEGKSSEGNVAEVAVETMKEVITESAEDRSHEKVSLAPSVSNRSDASVRSFAFPILTGDLGRSAKSGSPRIGPDRLQSQSETQPQPQQPQAQQPEPKPITPSQPPASWTGWLSCFTCCSSHS